MKKLKVLNLYAGIGGNRKLWQDVDVTAVELDSDIAAIYQDYFPDDKVVVMDAHQYLLDHYKEYDFIWASPPCPTHSGVNNFLNAQGIIRYPDMALYQEIIFLKHFFKGIYCIENVKPYYDPLIKDKLIGRHLFWANFLLGKFDEKKGHLGGWSKDKNGQRGDNKNVNRIFDLSKFNKIDKNKVSNNCVHPETGLYILNCARNIITKSNIEQTELFE